MSDEPKLQSVRINTHLVGRIGVREWGLPTLVMPGKIWRSKTNGTITCMLPKGREAVRIETRPLVVVERGSRQWMPMVWREALWQYVRAWPASGCELGPFLATTEKQRNAMLRELAEKLVSSDEIGCRAIANDIGNLAAYGLAEEFTY